MDRRFILAIVSIADEIVLELENDRGFEYFIQCASV